MPFTSKTKNRTKSKCLFTSKPKIRTRSKCFFSGKTKTKKEREREREISRNGKVSCGPGAKISRAMLS